MPQNAYKWAGIALLTSPTGFLLVIRSDRTTRSRNIKPEVVFKVQKMARYASFCLIMGPFKGKVPVFARLWPVRVMVRVSYYDWGSMVGHPELLVR